MKADPKSRTRATISSLMEFWKASLVTLSIVIQFCCGNECPHPCSCSTEANKTSVVCTSENITVFPSNLPRQSTFVSLTFTNVSALAPYTFAGLTQLEELHLSNNKLASLPSTLFKYLPCMHTLDLTSNLLEDLPAGIFNTSVTLKNLVLNGNCLTTLKSSWFHHLQKMEWLDVSNNKLQRIPEDCFLNLPRLKILDLSHNDLHVLPDGLFFGVPNLERLNLENINLRFISEDAFTKMPNLMFLFLQHNHLKSLPSMLFQPLSLLDTLDLSHNILSSVPCGLFLHNTNLGKLFEQGLDLSWNPWHCDCHLAYLRQWMDEHTSIVYSMKDTLCDEPKKQKGQRLMAAKIPYLDKSCYQTSCPK